MKRDLDSKIFNLDGTPVKMNLDPKDIRIAPDKEEEPDDMSMKYAISQALLLSKPDGNNSKENVTRYHLAKKVYEGGVQDFKSEDISLIKKSVGEIFGPLVVGQVFDWCDTDYVAPESEK